MMPEDERASLECYNEQFYRDCIKESQPTAWIFADVIMDFFNPKSVIDVGCGCGIYMREFKRHGIEIVGIEASRAARKIVISNGLWAYRHDLRDLFKHHKKYDTAICLEVAEHIDSKYSETLVETLTNLSDLIIFTTANKKQGGVGHINVKPKEFWIELFKTKGFEVSKDTERVSRELFMRGMLWYISDNLIIFRRV